MYYIFINKFHRVTVDIYLVNFTLHDLSQQNVNYNI